jgi:tRNA/rRNA methyltransferase/tRNA (cytidine32/uridine32-2'-O)-methyltransferase
MRLDDVVIVLSRPSESGNIGAACRAMMNMGLARLRVVREPETPWDEARIRARAVHAEGIWDRAERFSSLAEAVAGFPLVIGTTRRTGRRRKSHTMTAAETAAYLREHPGPAALVFGNERTGLDDGELNLCNLAAHIPASEAFPSLNLSHAVQIFCYELYRALPPEIPRAGNNEGAAPELPQALRFAEARWAANQETHRAGRRWTPLDQSALEGTVHAVTDSLASLGFYKQPGREEQERFFRDIFARAALTRREAAYLERIFDKAARLARKGGGGPPDEAPPRT